MKKGISPATIAIVAVLLGALGLASSKVTPPPPGPPEPPKPPEAATANPAPHDDGDEEGHRPPGKPRMPTPPVKTAATGRTPTVKAAASKTPPKEEFNPNSIDVDTTYWKTYQDGQKGITAMDARMKKAMAKQEAERKALAAKPKPVEEKGAGFAPK